MVKLILGLQGAGKTKQLVQDINEAVKTETGSMVWLNTHYERTAPMKNNPMHGILD